MNTDAEALLAIRFAATIDRRDDSDWNDVLQRRHRKPLITAQASSRFPPTKLIASRLQRRGVLLALAVAVALMLIAVGGWITNRPGTEVASAAEVRAKLAEGLRFTQTVRGEFSVRTQSPGQRPRGLPGCVNCTPSIPLPSRFVIGTDGSYSSVTLPLEAKQRNDVTYDAATRVETRFFGIYIRSFNLDPAAVTYAPEAQLAAWVQGALADRDPNIKNTTYEGRPAWELTVTFIPGQYLEPLVRVDVVVDQQTGIVLQVTRYAYDTERWTSIESVHSLEFGTPTSAADFTVPKPPGAREFVWDVKFRRVPVAAAEAIVGYPPLLPTNTLGRARSDFAVAKTTNLAPPESGSPAIHDVVSARYGDGPDSITVSTRTGRLNELLTNTGLAGHSARPLKPKRGPFVGDYAYISTDPLTSARFAAFHQGLLVQVTAPSAHDAITVAESLRPVP
jgi:hypothetical protein